jgi:hypothetical protein
LAQINPKEIYDVVSNFKNSPGPQFDETDDLVSTLENFLGFITDVIWQG